MICFAWSDARVREIPNILRMLLRLPEFKSKSDRMGKVLRVADHQVRYYSYNDKQIKSITKLDKR